MKKNIYLLKLKSEVFPSELYNTYGLVIIADSVKEARKLAFEEVNDKLFLSHKARCIIIGKAKINSRSRVVLSD